MDTNKQRDPLPDEFESIEAVAEFWDTHSLSDYEDQLQEVEIDVRAQRRRRVTLAPEVWERVAAQAGIRGITPETLVNLWLMEHAQA